MFQKNKIPHPKRLTMENDKRLRKVNHFNFQINSYKTEHSLNVIYEKTFCLQNSTINLSDSSDSKTVIIKNCSFHGKVIFDLKLDSNKSVELFFTNCDFNNDFILDNRTEYMSNVNMNFTHCGIPTKNVTIFIRPHY